MTCQLQSTIIFPTQMTTPCRCSAPPRRSAEARDRLAREGAAPPSDAQVNCCWPQLRAGLRASFVGLSFRSCCRSPARTRFEESASCNGSLLPCLNHVLPAATYMNLFSGLSTCSVCVCAAISSEISSRSPALAPDTAHLVQPRSAISFCVSCRVTVSKAACKPDAIQEAQTSRF